MIRTPPEHNTENPPVYADVPPGNPRPRGSSLRDTIKRVQDEEQLPSPQPKAEKALEELKKALLEYCERADAARRRYGPRSEDASIYTDQIRKIIKENT